MANPPAKAIRAAQYRAKGPIPGMRVLRGLTGKHRWRMTAWLTYHPDHAPVDWVEGSERRRKGEAQTIVVDAPCHPSDLIGHYTAAIAELCADSPTIIDGGFDAYILPPARRTAQITRKCLTQHTSAISSTVSEAHP